MYTIQTCVTLVIILGKEKISKDIGGKTYIIVSESTSSSRMTVNGHVEFNSYIVFERKEKFPTAMDFYYNY